MKQTADRPKGIPSPARAEELLREAARSNPGPWESHSRAAAFCAETIGARCGMDPEACRVLGLLHDIGRGGGVYDFLHVWNGWTRMNALGFPGAARICLTHSFPLQELDCYAGNTGDCTPEQREILMRELNSISYDDYDRLIQLCDALALPDGPTILEKRLVDVSLRHGFNRLTLDKWRAVRKLKEDFEEACGEPLYPLLGVSPDRL